MFSQMARKLSHVGKYKPLLPLSPIESESLLQQKSAPKWPKGVLINHH